MTTILSVAEKPSVARELAKILCENREPNRRNGKSKYNHIFDLGGTKFRGQYSRSHTMTSVSGHTMNTDFGPDHKSWSSCDPVELFDAPVFHQVNPEAADIVKSLENEAPKHNTLLLWLDCDLEGENIAFEVIEIVKKINPRIDVYRARFSALIPRDIFRAMQAPERPNENMNNAVEARKEIDLRIGAAFTRFQTKRLQNKYEGIEGLVSYGPCQFPTLGFVIERHLRMEAFRKENFWKLCLNYIGNDPTEPSGKMECNFTWDRVRMFDRISVYILYEMCLEQGHHNNGDITPMKATVVRSDKRPTSRWRPVPLNTVELQKRASRFLRLSSERTMQVAEELYNRGILSYPRTETDFFKEGFELLPLIEEQQRQSIWGQYANNLLINNNQKFEWPKNGGHDDQAHPPIHPLKSIELNDLTTIEEKGIYELVTRHFLACCSQDARGDQTTLKVRIGSSEKSRHNNPEYGFYETFTATGLMITERNWLDIYKWEHWSAKKVPHFNIGDEFEPQSFTMEEGSTESPSPISESDLIGVMDKNGIGTDATIASHIKTIQDRMYAIRDNNGHFLPTKLGMALFEAYKDMGYNLTKPTLRASMERDCQLIARGSMTKNIMMNNAINHMKETFKKVNSNAAVIDRTMAKYFNYLNVTNTDNFRNIRLEFSLCSCGKLMSFKGGKGDNPKDKDRRVLYCTDCCVPYWVPGATNYDIAIAVNNVDTSPVICPICQFQVLIANAKTTGKKPWHFCPHCYSKPPPPPDGFEITPENFPCYTCAHSTCTLATRVLGSDVDICSCSDPLCTGTMRVKKIANGKYMVSCTRNDKSGNGCNKKPWWVPKYVKNMIPQVKKNCQRCQSVGGVNILLIKFSIKISEAPPGTDPEFTICPCCDRFWSDSNSQCLATPAIGAQQQREPMLHQQHNQDNHQQPQQGFPPQQPQIQHHQPQQQQQQQQQQYHAPQQPAYQSIQAPSAHNDYGVLPINHHHHHHQQQQQHVQQEYSRGHPPPAPQYGGGGSNTGHGAAASNAENIPLCDCNQPCKELTSGSAANPNRVFFKCGKNRDDPTGCKFFKWADELRGTAHLPQQQQQQQRQQQYEQPYQQQYHHQEQQNYLPAYNAAPPPPPQQQQNWLSDHTASSIHITTANTTRNIASRSNTKAKTVSTKDRVKKTASSSAMPPPPASSDVKCMHCKGVGHYAKYCPNK